MLYLELGGFTYLYKHASPSDTQSTHDTRHRHVDTQVTKTDEKNEHASVQRGRDYSRCRLRRRGAVAPSEL